MNKINIFINNELFFYNSSNNINITILEFCIKKGIYIPFFCFNKNLNIAGNCRVCIVEIYKIVKPIISCLNFIYNNIKIYTFSFSLKKFHENILEFLLINHPLDCPVCDQAGECDLQEQSMFFGFDRSRFFFKKKSVIDFFINKYIKLILNRCILCLRCIRFLSIYNINFKKVKLGVIGRGSFSKISSYFLYNKSDLFFDYSNNIIDLCPVGALTLKSNKFISRFWEELHFYFIDLFDLLGSPLIYVFVKLQFVKVLPVLDSIFFFDYISDYTKYNFSVFKKLNLFFYNKSNLKFINKSYTIFNLMSYIDFFLYFNFLNCNYIYIKNSILLNLFEITLFLLNNLFFFNRLILINIFYFIKLVKNKFFFYNFKSFIKNLKFFFFNFFDIFYFIGLFKFLLFLKKKIFKFFYFFLENTFLFFKKLSFLKNKIINFFFNFIDSKYIKLNFIFNELNFFFFQFLFYEFFINFFFINFYLLINNLNNIHFNNVTFKTTNYNKNFINIFFNLKLSTNILTESFNKFYNIIGINCVKKVNDLINLKFC